MRKLSVLEELASAIRTAAGEADPAAPSRELATEFYESHPDLIADFQRIWVEEKITFLIARQRAAKARERDPQRVLGFHRMPAIRLASGKRIREREATLAALKLWRRRIGSITEPAREEIDKRIAFLEPYAKRDRGITLGQALALEAKKRGLGEK